MLKIQAKKYFEIQAKKDSIETRKYFCNSMFNRTVRLIESTEQYNRVQQGSIIVKGCILQNIKYALVVENDLENPYFAIFKEVVDNFGWSAYSKELLYYDRPNFQLAYAKALKVVFQ